MTGIHGDPSFATKAANLVFDNIQVTLSPRFSALPNSDFLFEFLKAGMFSIVSHWLNRRPDLTPQEMCGVMEEFYANIRKMLS